MTLAPPPNAVQSPLVSDFPADGRCPVLDRSELDRFPDEFYRCNRPVILRGFDGPERPEIFDWSPEFLAERLADGRYPVMVGADGFFSYERDMREMSFREFMERCFGDGASDGRTYYFRQPTSALSGVRDDSEEITPLAPYLRRSVVRNLWVSGRGPVVGLHFDPAENLNFQLSGAKRFKLFAPGLRDFYPQPMFSERACISGVSRERRNPDLTKFPRFQRHEALDVLVEAGDVLYLPAYWWHEVESVGAQNVNLNVWWLPDVTTQLRHFRQALRGYIQLGIRKRKYGDILKAPPETPADARS